MVKRTVYTDISLTKIEFIPVMLFLICCAVSLLPQNVIAQKIRPAEYQVKAAFLYNFVKFIDLPAGSFRDSPKMMLCIIGKDPFESNIELIQGKLVKNRELTVRHIKTVQEAGDCQILYISQSEKGNITQILKGVGGQGIITIGDTEGFSEQGVIINLFLEQDMVRFEININAARKANIQISSKLLKLAKIIDSRQEDN